MSGAKRAKAAGLCALLIAAGAGVVAAAGPRPAEAPLPPPPPGEEQDVMFFARRGGARLGVNLADIDADRARALKLKEEAGAEITSVLPGSPAEESGLKKGDVVLEYQGTRVESAAQLARMVRETPSGRNVAMKISRDGAPQTVRTRLEDHAAGPRGRATRTRSDRRVIRVPPIEIPDIEMPDIPMLGSIPLSIRLGASVEDLTPQLAEFFGVKNGGGVLVRSVTKGSPGGDAGLRAGDVIVKVDDDAIDDPAALRFALRQRRDKELKLTVVRDRREQVLTVAPPRDEDDEEAARAFDFESLEEAIATGLEDASVAVRSLADGVLSTLAASPRDL